MYQDYWWIWYLLTWYCSWSNPMDIIYLASNFVTCISESSKWIILDVFAPFSINNFMINKNRVFLFELNPMISVCQELFYSGNPPIIPYFGKDSPNFGVIFIIYIFVFESIPNRWWSCVYAFISSFLFSMMIKLLAHSYQRIKSLLVSS